MTNEARIVWCEDITRVDYVRVGMIVCPRRAGRPKPDRAMEILEAEIFGWAELNDLFKPYVPRQFDRRVFWLQCYDRGQPRDFGGYDGQAPLGAVDPRTVERGRPGCLTVRAWGGFDRAVAEAAQRQVAIETHLA